MSSECHDRSSASLKLPAFRRFADDEGGSLTIFSLYLLMIVFFTAGIAVDVVRFEADRARLQNTLDRAILAAADMDQNLEATEVVRSYFEKAGLDGCQPAVDVNSEHAYKIVSASGNCEMETFFMKLLDIPTLLPAAAGSAEESISDVEISLVLDVSGSMRDAIYETTVVETRYGSRTYRYNTGVTKIESLKNAAKEFVDTIFGNTIQGRTTVSIVPFSAQVVAGQSLLQQYNVTYDHGYSWCLDIPAGDFSSSVLDPATSYRQAGHMDAFNSASAGKGPFYYGCDPATNNAIYPFGTNADLLKARIDSLTPDGNTSADVGMKWGVALLDPATRPVVANLISAGVVDAAAQNRPFNYTNASTMKVVVVMTDGENTTQWALNDAFRTGPSGVYKYVQNGVTYYSVAQAEGFNTDRDGDGAKNEAYWIESECVRKRSDGTCTTSTSYPLNANKWQAQPKGGSDAVQLTFPELWNEMTVDYHATNLRKAIFNSNADYNYWHGVFTPYDQATKDARLDAICTAAKDKGDIVFAIGFELSDSAATLLRNCATSVNQFYRVNGLEITTAFQSIANAIGKLRLTQ